MKKNHLKYCSMQYIENNYNGISHKKSCTDFYFLIVFILFISGWIAITNYAYRNGDIRRLSTPKDSLGRTCGVDEDVKDAKYLLFFDISQCVSFSVFIFGCPTKQICVRECPKENWFSRDVRQDKPVAWKQVQDKLICNDSSIPKTVNSMERFDQVIKNEMCAPYYLKSTSAFFHLCLPSPIDLDQMSISYGAADEFAENAQNYFSYIYKVSELVQQDLRKCWHIITLFIFTSIVVCLFTILILGVVTRIVVWIILSLILILLLYSSVVSYSKYSSIQSGNNVTIETSESNHDEVNEILRGYSLEQLCSLFQQKEFWLVIFITSLVLFTIFSLLIIFLRSRIGLATMLIGEGSKAVNMIKSTLCFPIVSRALQLFIFIWFLGTFLYVSSLGSSVYTVQGLQNDSDCFCSDEYQEDNWCLPYHFNNYCHSISRGGACLKAACVFKEFRSSKLKLYFQLFNFFGLLWGLYFVSGFSRMILSSCFATWYWTFNKYDIPFFTLSHSFFTVVRYHLGTIAIGSFFISTCGFLRTILEHTQKVLKQSDGLVSQCLTWSLRGCFWILQKFLIFISNKAYVMCSIIGEGFFSSAHEAFTLIVRNVVRVVVLDKVLDFIILISKLVVTLLLIILSYFTFTSAQLKLNYPLVPIILVGVITWLIASSFFEVFMVAVDTLFLSFLKDSEINDGTHHKPYYMSQRLKYILRNKDQSNDKSR